MSGRGLLRALCSPAFGSMALLLTACGVSSSVPSPVPPSAVAPIVLSMRCDDAPALIVYGDDGEGAALLYRAQLHSFVRAVSASGARYVGAEGEDDEWWNKGDNARLTLRGEFVAECVPDAETDGAYPARGNEPFWNLVLGRAALDYRTMEGETRQAVLRSWQLTASALVFETDDGLQLQIAPVECSDSMSGQPYPHSVRLMVGAETRQGCGGRLLFPGAPAP